MSGIEMLKANFMFGTQGPLEMAYIACRLAIP